MTNNQSNTQDLQGKVVLITGATEGLGKAAALNFAKRGASVTVIGRNRQKTAQVVDELKSQSGNQQVKQIICDLTSLHDVKRAAEEFRRTNDRLDILANNAGAMFNKSTLTVDGYEVTFALSHLSHFLLTTSLLDLIRSTPGARVVSTSSGMQASGDLNLATVATDVNRARGRTYGTAKLSNILFTKELQRRLGPSVAVNCFHPGIVRTKFGAFGQDFGFLFNIVFKLSLPFSKSPEQGADTMVWLATSPDASGLRGEYLTNRRVIKPQKQALDDGLAAGLWSLSEELCQAALARRS